MSAERIALNAALDHSTMLERRIKELEAGIETQYLETNQLRRQIDRIRAEVSPPRNRDPMGPQCEKAMPENFTNRPVDNDSPRAICPHCGR